MHDEMDSVTGPIDVQEIEREALEGIYGGLVFGYARAPRETIPWLIARALLPGVEARLRELGWTPRGPQESGE
jgi:hypothetical protein